MKRVWIFHPMASQGFNEETELVALECFGNIDCTAVSTKSFLFFCQKVILFISKFDSIMTQTKLREDGYVWIALTERRYCLFGARYLRKGPASPVETLEGSGMENPGSGLPGVQLLKRLYETDLSVDKAYDVGVSCLMRCFRHRSSCYLEYIQALKSLWTMYST